MSGESSGERRLLTLLFAGKQDDLTLPDPKEFDENISMSEARWLTYFTGIFIAGASLFFIRHFFLTPPEKAMREFYAVESTRPEEIIDPLILAGRRVVPLLVREVPKKEMPRRRQAIAALGNLGDWRAMPVLETMLADTSELDCFRADALEAIALIDKDLGHFYAKKYAESDSAYLARSSRNILSGGRDYPLYRRSFFDALYKGHE